MTLAAALAALYVALAAQGSGADARAEALRRELADVAARIERMKAAGVRGGPEIQALLSRSEGLASELERLERRPRPAEAAAADPQELRERADALRDEVDRLERVLADVERRLAEEGRRRRAGRLARLEEEGALFSESTPGRIGAARTASQAGGGASGAGGPGVPAGPTGAPGAGGEPAPFSPMSPTPTSPSPTSPSPTSPSPTSPTPTSPTPTSPSPSSPAPPSTPPSEVAPASSPPGETGAAPADDRGGAAPSAGGVGDTHLWSPPGGVGAPWTSSSLRRRGYSAAELRRERDALTHAIEGSRAQIRRLEAEARELDARP